MNQDAYFMRKAIRLAQRGLGCTAPNPLVGAVLVKNQIILGRGWHHRAGLPHAEIEALNDAARRGHSVRGATLYVTLEPCCTHGRTPPCTDAIQRAGIRRVVIGATDPNPSHAGRGFRILRKAGISVATGVLADLCTRLNQGFNHWILHRRPFVTVKAAMTLDGKIATATGESKWITGAAARANGMKLRAGHDAILVGVNTILADDPSLTVRLPGPQTPERGLRRIILDSMARTPLQAKVVSDPFASDTIIVVSRKAPKARVLALARRAHIWVAPLSKASSLARIDLAWLLRKLGANEVTSLLVEGGGEVNASFLLGQFAHRIAFYFAPKILGGREARKGVAGDGIPDLRSVVTLREVAWQKLGPDFLLTARVN